MSERPRRPERGMTPVTRRRFLTGIGAVVTTVVGGYALDAWTRGPAAGASAAAKPVVDRLDRTLVVVELGGGNDGLNTVVPLTDARYHQLRPTLGITDAIELDGQVGLHPKLAKLAARYKAGQVAIVEGVGYPDPDLSHFASMATWWSARPGQTGSTGWLGRYLDETVGFDDPLAGVVIGPGPSPALLGERSFATSIADAGGLQPTLPPWADSPDEVLAAWRDFAPADVDRASLAGRVEDAIRLTMKARGELDRDLSGASTSTAPNPLAGRGQYESTAADSLALAAQLVASKSPPRVVYVNGLGDFDVHQGETQRHALLMQQLDAGIEAFFTTLEKAGVAERATLITTSEFGRRPAENGSGTDHGTANARFVVGPHVKGGRYGEPPSLTALDPNGNLVHTVDFRAYFATMLDGWLGFDPAKIVGKDYAPLPLFA